MTTEGSQHDVRRTYAVLGSTGKATTCYLLEHVLAALGRSTSLFSTVEIKVGSERSPLERDAQPDLTDLVARSEADRIDDTIIELRWPELSAGSLGDHALDLALFTHLDRGVEGERYEEHLELISGVLAAAGRAVILIDDPAGIELARRVPGAITVGSLPREQDADWQVTLNATRQDHIDFTVTHRGGRSVSTSLWIPTRFSVGYAALTLVAVMETGISGGTIASVLPHGLRPVVPGRIERVADHPRCIVDIAHNPARLARALLPLRRSSRGKVIVVVAARAADDAATRQAIGRAAATADVVVVTDDDYGVDDDPAAIRADVIAGAREAGAREVAEVSPRRTAIRGAVAMAGRDDTVLVAGRGHLGRILIAGERDHLDDREEVRAGIAQRHATGG
ncbi:glutamate ligase domain-containing protein [Pseudactinotalea terrae]|uniref:glutamate ligase domain-containing protein n=1 Tax=Pseudactinotalea terrae TaxID=1743262 RepID=UPI0012E2C50D|nr:cyanophycin synthetase [Pseudactinotalea terrae]